MSKQNFSKEDLVNKGYTEGEDGIWHPKAKTPMVQRALNSAEVDIESLAEKIFNDPSIKEKTDKAYQDILLKGFAKIEFPKQSRNIDLPIKFFWDFVKANLKAYEFNITPNTKPRQTVSDRWNKRKCVMQYRRFADSMRARAAELNFQLTSPVIVEFYVPMPVSWSRKKRLAMDGQPHTQTPDYDNFLKSAGDSLLGQDNLLSDCHARKIWSTEGKIIIYQ